MGQLLSLGFDAGEREFFARALEESGGPAHVTDALAVFVGFTEAAHMVKRCNDIADQVRCDGRIDIGDLKRSQLACEILFASLKDCRAWTTTQLCIATSACREALSTTTSWTPQLTLTSRRPMTSTGKSSRLITKS
ncbi:hypothetical protein GCM10027447_36200 [Glycomyces halotolerans]